MTAFPCTVINTEDKSTIVGLLQLYTYLGG